MDAPIREFYKEVTGTPVSTTNTALRALDRWKVPYFTNTQKGSVKTFWRVDIKHIDAAKNAYTKELEKAAAKKAKKSPHGRGPLLDTRSVDNEGFTLMQRMANVEQELRTLRETVENFVKRF